MATHSGVRRKSQPPTTKKHVGGAGKNPGPRATRVDEGIGKKIPIARHPIHITSKN